jgi:hypothetical protein
MKAQSQKLEAMRRKLERLGQQHARDKVEYVSAWQVPADADVSKLLAQSGLQLHPHREALVARRRDVALQYERRLESLASKCAKPAPTLRNSPDSTGQNLPAAHEHSEVLSTLWAMSWLQIMALFARTQGMIQLARCAGVHHVMNNTVDARIRIPMIQQKHIPVKNDGQTLRTVERGLGKELTKAMDKSWMRKIEHDSHKLKSAVHECEESAYTLRQKLAISLKKAQDATAASSKKKKKAHDPPRQLPQIRGGSPPQQNPNTI